MQTSGPDDALRLRVTCVSSGSQLHVIRSDICHMLSECAMIKRKLMDFWQVQNDSGLKVNGFHDDTSIISSDRFELIF